MGSSKTLLFVALSSLQVGVCEVQVGQAGPNQEVVEC